MHVIIYNPTLHAHAVKLIEDFVVHGPAAKA